MREAHLRAVRAHIARQGWTVSSPGGTLAALGDRAYAYTIGLTAAGCPELVRYPVHTPGQAQVLDLVARWARDHPTATPPAHTPTSHVVPEVGPVAFVPVPTEGLITARALYGDRVPALVAGEYGAARCGRAAGEVGRCGDCGRGSTPTRHKRGWVWNPQAPPWGDADVANRVPWNGDGGQR